MFVSVFFFAESLEIHDLSRRIERKLAGSSSGVEYKEVRTHSKHTLIYCFSALNFFYRSTNRIFVLKNSTKSTIKKTRFPMLICKNFFYCLRTFFFALHTSSNRIFILDPQIYVSAPAFPNKSGIGSKRNTYINIYIDRIHNVKLTD